MYINDGLENVTGKIDSFIMLGQSNMAGRGDPAEVEEIKNPNCYMMRNGRWQYMSEPINPDRSVSRSKYRSGISLAASFADRYAKFYGTNVGLIGCADGNTCISQWQKGTILFDNAVFHARIAQRTSELRGILWHQGESDCGSEEDLAAWEGKFTAFLRDFREAVGIEDLPIIAGELSYEYGEVCKMEDRNTRFNENLRTLPERVKDLYVVSADSLTLKSDRIHFDSASLRVFGERYFEVYRKQCVGNE